jgi:multicomponent Na+:H+ antiporter subunit E
MLRRGLALFCVAFAVWILLSWTATLEQLIVGAVCSVLVAVVCAPLGPVAAPWSMRPRRMLAIATTSAWAVGRIVRANLSLSRRIWTPRPPLRPGMVIVATEMESEGELTAVGLISSLIVDNQIVDVDRSRHELLYHAVWIDSGDPADNRRKINGPLEERIRAIVRG